MSGSVSCTSCSPCDPLPPCSTLFQLAGSSGGGRGRGRRGALPCGCQPLIQSIRRYQTTIQPLTRWPGDQGKFPLVATYSRTGTVAGVLGDGRKEVDSGWEGQMARCGAGQLHMGWVPLLLKLVSLLLILVPLLLASSRIFVHSVLYMGGCCLGGVLQVYYYGRRSGRYLYCLCADHWLNRITNSGKHCRQTPLCFPSRRSRWASIQDRKQNFRDDWKFWGWVIDVQVQGRSWLTLSSSTLIARQLISSPNIYQRQTLPKCGTSRKQVIKWQ